MKVINVNDIDNLLPQTQCGLCGYGACRPYADAILHKKESLDRCPPGGVKTLKALGQLLNEDVNALISEMRSKEKPSLQAIIREAECIGCTKCIQACPVDAIIGTAKYMHTVIADECTGCELCLEPCPVDCIDMIKIDTPNEIKQQQKSNTARIRYYSRQKRLQNLKNEKLNKHQSKKSEINFIAKRKTAIAAAVERVKAKKDM